VQHVVERMNGLMLQLRTGTTPVEKPRQVDLGAVVRRACAAKSGQRSTIRLESSSISAIGHEDRLEHVIGHLVQNALDATAPDGDVLVKLVSKPPHAVIEVQDRGTGMTPEFIRERLFKPFETTKASGMGIGVYESVQYIRSLDGDIEVESIVGEGTTIRVLLQQPENDFVLSDERHEPAESAARMRIKT
jgi:signal transduction histidine kinase